MAVVMEIYVGDSRWNNNVEFVIPTLRLEVVAVTPPPGSFVRKIS